MKRGKSVGGDGYVYLASRLNAMETNLPDRDRMRRFCEAKTRYELYRLLSEAGVADTDGDGCEDEIDRILPDVYRFVLENVPDPSLFSLFCLPWDCHNLKAAVKAYLLADGKEFEDNARRLMLPCGTVSEEEILKAVRTGDTSPLPAHLGAALPEVIAQYAKSGDPRALDTALDGACFADMKAQTEKYRAPFFTRLLAAKADTANLLAAVRILRMGGGKEAFSEAFVVGGTIGKTAFLDGVDGGEEALSALLTANGYEQLAPFCAPETSLSALEKAADEAYLRVASEGKDRIFSPDRVAWHLILREMTVKDLRIILSCVKAGRDADSIRERLREFHV